jgi:hypothetical protein
MCADHNVTRHGGDVLMVFQHGQSLQGGHLGAGLVRNERLLEWLLRLLSSRDPALVILIFTIIAFVESVGLLCRGTTSISALRLDPL